MQSNLAKVVIQMQWVLMARVAMPLQSPSKSPAAVVSSRSSLKVVKVSHPW